MGLPRLVPACELVSFFPFHPIPNDSSPSSRLKKQNCPGPSPEAECEACKSTNIPFSCELYYARRRARELRSVAFLFYPPSASYLTIRSEINAALNGFSVASGSSSLSVSS
jgi:hypothetical protein